ncbi:hypothetical protein DRQ25_13815 [Candidatus Fermentibacteria bacterium]|nr:MAG: hypothetical protein DRQ25_13815 [Candidatus Fermentibacteria bacterium]
MNNKSREGADMAEELTFTVKDIPACTRYGFSARKIWIFFKTLVLSWVIWDFFVYLGFFAAGYDLASVWSQSRLLPLPGSLFWADPVPVILLAAGVVLIIYVLMRGSLMVSKMTFQQLRGDEFFSASDAASFAKEHTVPLISIPSMLVLTLLLIYGAGALTGLISRIPAAGPVAAALLSLPLWGAMLLGVLTLLALILSLKLMPAIVACTGGDSFESIFEVFSTLTSQSWRLFLYWLLSILVIVLGVSAFLLLSSVAISFLSLSVSAGAGDTGLVAALTSGPQMLAPEALPFFAGLLGQQGDIHSWSGPAGLLAGISGTAIFLIIISYFLSSCSSAWTLIYVVLKYRKDGENLIDRVDREEQREFERMYEDSEKNSEAGKTDQSE